MSYINFSDLPIWQQGAHLLLQIYKITTNFPIDERYALTAQLKRSANSIIANISESHGRYFYKDKVRILYITRGEVEEVKSHLLISYKLSFISKENYYELSDQYDILGKNLNAYISSLVKKYKNI